MLRLFFPFLLLVLAVIVFMVWTDPLINSPKIINSTTSQVEGGIIALREEAKVLKGAIGDARSLKDRISELNIKLDQISPSQISRLDTFLPESIDGIQLVVDVNNIAARSGLKIDKVSLNESGSKTPLANLSNVSKVVPVTLSFVTTGSYSQIRSLASDLASSLRIMDMSRLSFTVNDDRPTEYSFSLNTYWIK